MMNLQIDMESLEFIDDLILPNDKVRVIITSLPDEKSSTFNINAKKIEEFHQSFTFEVSKLTKKLIIIFRRKSHLKKDNIIASTIIRSDQFPKDLNDKTNSKAKNIQIYEPFPKELNDYQSVLENRKVLGQMEVQFTLSKKPENENKTDKHEN
ncbi:hypothetical protein M9Y10_026869 [Tritrichomonas musculus]|uniref:Uncharacterized protein n=1 Tax=Tritrichomonas musculus TaxID=1915356 RepID=A0ABR2H857_9EUKA